jgi:hypothetical protein
MVKSAVTEYEQMCLKREHHNYKIDSIATSPHIRALYDTVHPSEYPNDTSCLVFEWMDYPLSSVSDWYFRSHPTLPKIVSKSVLSALDVLNELNAIHTGKIHELTSSEIAHMSRRQSEQYLCLSY